MDLKERIKKASEVLSVKDFTEKEIAKSLTEILDKIGVDDSEIGIQVLEAETTEFELFENEFSKSKIKTDNLIVQAKDKIPIARLKVAWEILKGRDPFKKKDEALPNKDLYAMLKPIGQWGDNELLEKYVKNGSSEIEDQLGKRSKGRNCIVFNEDRTVNEEDSLYMLRKARQQEMPRTFQLRGNIVELFPVGAFPENIFHECPVHSNKLLIDGYCDECGKTWNVNDYNKNVFIRLLTKHEDVDIRLYRKLDFEELKNEFPKIFIIYRDLDDERKLPSMKKKSSTNVDGSDPFRVHKTY